MSQRISNVAQKLISGHDTSDAALRESGADLAALLTSAEITTSQVDDWLTSGEAEKAAKICISRLLNGATDWSLQVVQVLLRYKNFAQILPLCDDDEKYMVLEVLHHALIQPSEAIVISDQPTNLASHPSMHEPSHRPTHHAPHPLTHHPPDKPTHHPPDHPDQPTHHPPDKATHHSPDHPPDQPTHHPPDHLPDQPMHHPPDHLPDQPMHHPPDHLPDQPMHHPPDHLPDQPTHHPPDKTTHHPSPVPSNRRVHEATIKYLCEDFTSSSSADTFLDKATLQTQSLPLLVTANELEVLCQLSTNEDLSVVLRDDVNLLKAAVALLRRIHSLSKLPGNLFTSQHALGDLQQIGSRNGTMATALKRDLIRLIGNLCHNNRVNQDLVTQLDGLSLILDSTRLDATNPYITQWSVLAIRNLCDHNPRNQSLVAGLKAQSLANQVTIEELSELGVTAELVGEKVVVKGIGPDEKS